MEPCAAARQRPRWPGRQGEEIAEVILRVVYIHDFVFGQDQRGFRRQIWVTVIDRGTSARLSFRNAKRARRRGVAAKRHFKGESCCPPGSRRSNRDDVTVPELDRILLQKGARADRAIEFRTERTPVYHLEKYTTTRLRSPRKITEGKVGGERDLLRPSKRRHSASASTAGGHLRVRLRHLPPRTLVHLKAGKPRGSRDSRCSFCSGLSRSGVLEYCEHHH